MSAQSSLSHCTTTRPGMLAFSSGTHASRWPWQMTMPPECWPRCRGRSCISPHSAREQPHAIGIEIEADRRRDAAAASRRDRRNSNWFITLREAIDLRGVEPERLPHFARRAAAAVGDDVGGHRRAEPAVASRRRAGSRARADRRSADRDRCRATRRAPPTGTARTADPCRPDRPP